ncbi:hypothetical protein T484DRAFT_1944092 [Baffinella frigidus]|nr:hypothetical protein T484DRAFT_1944092 [Cryptophyta sp. CCMP2293]
MSTQWEVGTCCASRCSRAGARHTRASDRHTRASDRHTHPRQRMQACPQPRTPVRQTEGRR